jgi:ribosomal protein S6--L-glutamate ligase
MEIQTSISLFGNPSPRWMGQGGSTSEGEISPVTAERLHVGILVEARYLLESQPLGVAAELKARGHKVTVIVPESHAYDTNDIGWLDGMDLMISRGRSAELLCLLHFAEAQGIATINRRAAIGSVSNRAETAVTLLSAGVPTPPAYVGPVRELAKRIPADDYPVILKPVFRGGGRGSQVVRSALELARISWPEPGALAQRFIPGDGYDLELYVIGRDVWALRKPSPLVVPPLPDGGPGAAGPVASLIFPTPAMEDLARGCGELFGLEYYGVNCIETPDGPIVTGVDEFPDYTGIDGANERLADFALRCARRKKR